MKKAGFVICCSLILASTPSLFGETRPSTPRISLGLIGGYISTPKYGSGPSFGGTLMLGITKNIALEVRTSRFQGAVPGETNGLSKGRLITMPIQLSLQVRIPVGSRIVPYILGGGGYFLNDFKIDSTIASGWSAVGFTINEDIEGSAGFHFGTGLDFLLSSHVGLNVDVRYSFTAAKGTWKLIDKYGVAQETGSLPDLKINPLAAGLGIRFGF
jgi:outer membrane protein W